jgi:hypothetical protein
MKGLGCPREAQLSSNALEIPNLSELHLSYLLSINLNKYSLRQADIATR